MWNIKYNEKENIKMKKAISIMILIVVIATATIIAYVPQASAAATTVTKSPTSYTGTWTAPQNALAQGSPISEDSTTNKQETYSGYSFAIPAGSSITKVELGIFASSINGATIRFQVSIDGTTYPYSYTATPPDFYSTGFSSDYQTISGISWTTTNVNQIRVLVTGFVGTGKTAYLDWVPIRVTYNTQVASSTTTQLSENAIMLGGSVTDTATVTTGATGNVIFQVSTNGVDFTQYGAAKTLSGTNPNTATSDLYTPDSTITYYFRAVYQGDNNYLGSQSADNAEVLSVNPAAVVPEYPLGALVAIAVCLVAFVAFKKRDSILSFRHQ
jgi:hypothetical protein